MTDAAKILGSFLDQINTLGKAVKNLTEQNERREQEYAKSRAEDLKNREDDRALMESIQKEMIAAIADTTKASSSSGFSSWSTNSSRSRRISNNMLVDDIEFTWDEFADKHLTSEFFERSIRDKQYTKDVYNLIR